MPTKSNASHWQPEYDTNKKGEKVQESGYEPQYYKLPDKVPGGASSWTGKPPAKRLNTKQLTRRYIKIKKVEFKEHRDTGVEQPKDKPMPRDL